MTQRFDDSAQGPYSIGTPAAKAPDTLTADWFRAQAALHEKTLRRQYEHADPPVPFPPEWEAALAKLDPDTGTGALRRWAYLKHLLWVRHENLSARGDESDDAKLLAAYQLITREPVPVRLGNGRLVHVTDRSIPALVEMGRHATAIAGLFADVERADEVIEAIVARITESEDRARRRTLRRRLQWVRDVKVRALTEMTKHRQSVYAHLFTESGAPAKSMEDAPDWWDEITRDDEKRLVEAVNEAGSGRTQKLGPVPKPPKRKNAGRWRYLESFDLLSPLARWGLQIPVTEAPWYDRPLGQALMFMRASADPVLDEPNG